MIVNSAKEFRTWVKNKDDRYDINENFIGSYYEENNKKIKGFFNLFHGKKENIETYLPSLLDIAEDNQAIYEFLQNAVDCGSTHFYAFYNDKYFLAVLFLQDVVYGQSRYLLPFPKNLQEQIQCQGRALLTALSDLPF